MSLKNTLKKKYVPFAIGVSPLLIFCFFFKIISNTEIVTVFHYLNNETTIQYTVYPFVEKI